MLELLAGILSVIMIIVFFMMYSTLAEIRRLAQKQVGQNESLLRLVTKLVNPNQKTMHEMINAGETVYLKNGDVSFRLATNNGVTEYFGKQKGKKEFRTSVDTNHFLVGAIKAQNLITASEYQSL